VQPPDPTKRAERDGDVIGFPALINIHAPLSATALLLLERRHGPLKVSYGPSKLFSSHPDVMGRTGRFDDFEYCPQGLDRLFEPRRSSLSYSQAQESMTEVALGCGPSEGITLSGPLL
jgi:hypothetical protein